MSNCCKCCRPAEQGDGDWEPLKMYRVPDIKYGDSPMGRIIGWDIYCEDCIQDWLEQFRKENDG